MGIFDTMFGTTIPTGTGWDPTVTTAGQETMGKAFGAGLQGAIKGSPFGPSGGEKSASSTMASPGAPAAAAPQIDYNAVMQRMLSVPKAGQGAAKPAQIWGPFGPG